MPDKTEAERIAEFERRFTEPAPPDRVIRRPDGSIEKVIRHHQGNLEAARAAMKMPDDTPMQKAEKWLALMLAAPGCSCEYRPTPLQEAQRVGKEASIELDLMRLKEHLKGNEDDDSNSHN